MPRTVRKSQSAPVPEPMLPSSYFSGAPWYAKFGLGIVMFVGLPTLLLVVFMLLYIGIIPSPLANEVRAMTELLRRHDEGSAGVKSILSAIQQYSERQERIMRQTCRNVATNPVEKVECER